MKFYRNKDDKISLFFDGKFLLFRVEREDKILRFHYKAVSGRPLDNGGFDYSKTRQKMKSEGPIPEGEYWINPQEIQYTKDGTSFLKWGTFPWGENA